MQHAVQPQLRLLHDSAHVVVIDKPAGVPFHRDPSQPAQPGLLQLCRAAQAAGGLPGGPLYPVHR